MLLMKLHDNTLLRSVGGAFLVNIVYAGLTFVSGIVLARVLGAQGLGIYDYAETWIEVLLIVAVFGFDRTFIRKIPTYSSTKSYGLIQGLLRFALLFSLLLTLLIIVLFSVFFVLLLHETLILTWTNDVLPTIVIDDQNLQQLWASLAALLLLPFRVGLQFIRGILHGFDRIIYGLLPDYVFRLLLFLLFLGGVTVVSGRLLPAWLAIGIHLVASIVAAIFGFIFVRKFITTNIRSATPSYQRQEWLSGSSSFVVLSIAALLNSRIGIIFLGTLAPLEQVSYYSVSLRIATVIVLAQTAMNVSIQPRIARFYADNNIQAMQNIITISVRTVMAVSIPIGFGLIILGTYILRLFGPDFVDSYTILIILIISQLINTLSGPAGTVLAMTDYARNVAYTNLVLLGGVGLVSWILIPTHGAVGAAIATATAIIFRNLIYAGLVYYHLKIVTLPFSCTRKTT